MTPTPATVASLGEEFVELSCRFDPVAATRVGIHDYDAQYPDDSPSGLDARRAWRDDIAGRAGGVDAAALGVAARVDLELLRSRLAAMRVDLEGAGHGITTQPWRLPMTGLAGIYFLEARAFAPLDERKEALLARLMALPDYLESGRRALAGASEPMVTLGADVARAGPAYVDEVARGLSRRFPAEGERIEYAASRARIGFARYQEFLERELAGRSDGPVGIGVDALETLLNEAGRLGRTAETLESEAVAECEALRAAIEAEARALDAGSTWRQQLEAIRVRRPDPARAREAYAAEAERARRFVADRGFAPVLDGRLEVVATPSYAREFSRTLMYVPPAAFESETSGLLCLTAADASRGEPAETPVDPSAAAPPDVAVAVARAAYPGTHLQCLHAIAAPSRLRRLGAGEASGAGWSLYAAERAVADGQVADPRGRLVMLRELLVSAWTARLDVEVHRGRTSIDEAVDVLAEACGLDRARAAVEVRRLLVAPGAGACAFAGRLDLIALSREAERRLGGRFRPSEFHAAVLRGGALPPALIRDELWERVGVA